uniref:Putative peritrophin-like protein n=1 Tax=Lutzomyia longipalpis TaxID=7200 RepID=A0A7G3AMM8_LUTLO
MSAMKVLIVCSIVVTFATFVVNCEEILPGIPINGRLRKSRAAWLGRADQTCGGTFGTKCKDCRTLMNCVGTDPPISTLSCAEKDPKKPYCVNTACSATPNEKDPSCKDTAQSDFLCTGIGYFPDASKCNRFYICPETGENKAVTYECPNNYVYKSKARGCVKKLAAADCYAVDCSKTPNEFGVYLKDPAYYYFCQKDKTTSRAIVMKCPDEDNMQFDPKVGYCTFRCPKEGYYVNVQDCTKYYYCYNVGSAFEVADIKCPDGFSFDPRTLKCIKTPVPCKPQVAPPTTTTPTPPSTTPSSSTAQPPSSTAQPPSSTAQPPSSTAQPPSSTAQPPSSTAQPPSSTAQPPSSTAQPPSSTA